MKNKLTFANSIPKEFEKHKEYVFDAIKCFFDALDVECELVVKFNWLNGKESINQFEITDCAIRNLDNKKHELLLTNGVLRSIDRDGGRFFISALAHEFEHLRDFEHLMATGLFDFNPCLQTQKDFERTYISRGYFFWTEVCAYYKTIFHSSNFEYDFPNITFGYLVKNYIKTKQYNKRIYYKKDLSRSEAEKYIEMVESFIYLCAKFLAFRYAYKARIPYTKIEKNKDYKQVYSILCSFEPKVKRIMRKPYSPKSRENLFKLGKYICENLSWTKFKVGLVQRKNKILQFY